MTAFQRFTDKLRKAVSKSYGETCLVEVNEIEKNNGVVYHGITIKRKDSNISPTIYLEKLYQEYEDGVPLGDILEKVIQIYEDHKIEGGIDLQFLLDFEKIKEKIVFRLIHYENNREMLSEVPYVRFLDMAVIFYCSIAHETLGNIAIVIKKNICRIWGIEKEELLLLAGRNTPVLLPFTLRSMEQIMEELGHISCVSGKEPCMYVLTNSRKMFGAACLLYPDVLKHFAQAADKSFYVLPSSVHEVILVPERKGFCGEAFRQIVKEMNGEQVEWEEVLSDSVYYYDREKGKLEKI